MDKPRSGSEGYTAAVAGMAEFGQTVKRLMSELLLSKEIVVHTIDFRVKAEQSARRKMLRLDAANQGYEKLHDLLGLRVTCYFSDDVDRIVELIEQQFDVDPGMSIDKGKQLGTREFGYRSVHRVAKISQNRAGLAEYSRYESLRFEIQIRTVLQHAWAEIEHDLGYKQETIPEPMSRRFSMLAGVLELVDYEFMALRDELAQYEERADNAVKAEATDLPLDLATLTALVKHESKFVELDSELAAFAKTGVQSGVDTDYLEQRLADLRNLGLDTVTALRLAIKNWEVHILAFAPSWMDYLDERDFYGSMGPTDEEPFAAGVSFYYLWLVINLESVSKGAPVPGSRFDDSREALRVWEETLERAGMPPELPSAMES
ncbi:GTP pyrophosphokinase family protein [Arthrobacter sp. zg-Y1116]|uniref:GTP pyrophosphokinase n=1 Tax=Arthrobacter sp. zg-Y1116 TaxID=2964611 RepID=UPI00210775B8|nr:hypothetical protein [Arthrobacter sp. zg-Y1116]MCQ1946060.1 hypothetical protein [Arthrobacter sp. zg-Y1116]